MDPGGERLTERERTILHEIELELSRQDPRLQRSLTTTTGLSLPYRIPVWGYLLAAAVMFGGAFVAQLFSAFLLGVAFLVVARWRHRVVRVTSSPASTPRDAAGT